MRHGRCPPADAPAPGLRGDHNDPMTRTGGEERRRQLIGHAVRLFGQRGFEGTSLEAVAEAAGVRKQTLLYYFPGKDELFDACTAELAERLASSLETALDEAGARGPPEAVVHALVRPAPEWPALTPFLREAARR